MTRKAKPPTARTVDSLRHRREEATRKNIPTAEYQSVVEKEAQDPVRVAYERRNRDLDPQLVWRGKDEQDWSDLVVQAPPLYIQEKVQPKALIDDLLRQTRESQNDAGETTPDLFADFNGIPQGVDKTEFYQHEQNWSNRMILGDSLQVMASLAHAYFLGANDPYGALKTTLKAEINEEAWATLHSDTSRPFDKPRSGRIAVKVINHLGDEVMKVFRVA
jgi:adenine-specific DNA-methyltransferase